MPGNEDVSREAMNWIDGQWRDAAKRSDSFDPATGERIGSYADADVNDALAAIEAASHAFHASSWKDDRPLRSRVLNQLADACARRRNELVAILSLETG